MSTLRQSQVGNSALVSVALALFAAAGADRCLAEIPPELARYVWTDSPLAVTRVIGEIDSPDATPAVIEVTAPATATIRMGAAMAGQSTTPAAATVSHLPIGSDPEGDVPNDVEYHPSGASYFILHRWTRNIVRFDAATNTPIQTYALSGELPQAMDITADGTKLIVAYFTQDLIASIDVASGAETTLATGNGPGVVEITPDGSRALIGCVIDSTIRVINLSTFSEERSIATPGYTQTLSVNSESGVLDLKFNLPFAFLGSSRVVFAARFDPTPTVAFIDYLTGTRNNLTTDPNPAGVAVSADGAVVAVSHASAAGTTTILNPVTESVVRTIPGPGVFANGPIVLNGNGTRAVIAFQNAARWLNLSTDTFGPALTATFNLEDLLVNTAGTRVIGVGFSGAIIDFNTGAVIGSPNGTVSCTRGAVSPITDRAVLASWPCFGDDIVVIDTDATPSQIFFGRTASLPEGDCSRNGAVSPNGQYAVSANVNSDNLSIFDTASGSLLHHAPLDIRPGEVEITPDNTRSVSVNLDATTLSVVNLSTGVTTAIPSATRLAQVEIDPAGAFAYVSQVASGDGVRKLNLATNTFVGGLTATGDMGSVGYVYGQVSQIALSPDGSLLATAGGFNDRLDIVNTSTMAVAQTLTMGTFITRVSWTPEGDEILVSDRDGDSMIVVRRPNSSSPFAIVGTIPVGDSPFDTAALAASNRAFVLNFGTPRSIGVLDTTSLSQTSTIPLPATNYPVGMALSADGTILSVLTANEATTVGQGNFSRVVTGELTIIDTATLAVVETIQTNQASAMLLSDAAGTTLASPAVSSEVLTVITPGCGPVDFNNDGIVDFFDYLDFVDAFSNNDPSADFNGDTIIDFFDYLDFVDAFSTGC